MKWGLTKKSEGGSSLQSMKNDFDRIFDDFFSLRPSTLFESEWLPSVDIEEDEKAIHVKAELPGLDEKDLSVVLENNTLTISGEKKEEKTEKDEKKRTIISERRFGSFSRTISMPEGVKSDQIKANFKKGILTVEIPKDESKQPKRIQIGVN